ncbi:MAG: 50S ribosomal protein L18 [Patescibacteria group bacterium]
MQEVKRVHSQRSRRRRRVRSSIRGTGERPRLSVFRSNTHLWVQLIDDARGVTLASASDAESVGEKRITRKTARVERAAFVGQELARQAKAKGIHRAVFDRGQYRYHGLVRAIADGARRQGLTL